MTIDINKDIPRGVEILRKLRQAYDNKTFFTFKQLPEDVLPEDMVRGSNEHLLYLTLVSSVAYLRREERLWSCARETWEDADLHYLFKPEIVITKHSSVVEHDLLDYNLTESKLKAKTFSIGKLKYQDRRVLREKDVDIWMNMSYALAKFNSNVEDLFKAFDYNALEVVKFFTTIPYSKGFPEYQKKRKVLIWLAKIERNALFQIKNLNQIPMASGAHIIRSTIKSGAIWGRLDSISVDLDQLVSDYWHDVAMAARDEIMFSLLQLQLYLWILAKYGCSKWVSEGTCPMKSECPISEFCVTGKFEILDKYITIDTKLS